MKKAVAVKYSRELPAPFIVAKGKGELAGKLLKIAREHNIEIIENRDLTESLIKLDIDDFIPEEFYEIMAQIIIFVRALGK